MNYLAVIKTVLAMLPLVIQAIQALEAAMPGSGNGSAKLAVIKETLSSAYKVSTDAVGTFDQLWPVLQTMIGAVVSGFNISGVFKKK